MPVSYSELEDRLESNPQGLVGETYNSVAVPIHDNQSAIYKGDWIVVIDSDSRVIKEVIER